MGAAEKLTELIQAGDALAAHCQGDLNEVGVLAERWIRLRGEMKHEAHLVLEELARIRQVTRP